MEIINLARTNNFPKQFSLTGFFPYKDKIVDSVFIWKNTGQRKPLFWHILRNLLFGYLDYLFQIIVEHCQKSRENTSG